MSFNPFWRSPTIEAEPVLLPRGEEKDRAAAGHLLFQPDTVLRVTNAAEDVVFEESSDYSIDALRRVIVRTPGSRIPGGSVASVTYTHRDTWPGDVPAFCGDVLPRTVARLRGAQPTTLCLTGDSITEGYDASGFHGVAPHRPPYAVSLERALRDQYGPAVRLHNLAAAGWTTDHAAWDTDRIASHRPDLVIVAYGMNDAAYADADLYVANVRTILARLRQRVAEVEFLLVSPMLPTRECTWVVPSRFEAYRRGLAALVAAGIAFADVTAAWDSLIRRKHPHELSGNGLNHPNDFGHRIYADVVGAALIDDNSPASSGANVATDRP